MSMKKSSRRLERLPRFLSGWIFARRRVSEGVFGSADTIVALFSANPFTSEGDLSYLHHSGSIVANEREDFSLLSHGLGFGLHAQHRAQIRET